MGRHTWESLPPRVRPLQGRRNVVLSATLDPAGAGVEVARSVEDVLAAHPDVWVIGGGAVYRAFLPHADQVVVTEVDTAPAGDTWAPELGPGWVPAGRFPAGGRALSAGGLPFRVTVWQRRSADGAPSLPAVLAEHAGTWRAGGRSGEDVGAGR